jgi:preprotein translocase subunit SecD
MTTILNLLLIKVLCLFQSNQDLEKINNILLQNIGLEEEDKSLEGITYKISKKSFNQSLSDMTLNAVEIVRSRVDFLGNKELSIQKVGLNKILLEIPW